MGDVYTSFLFIAFLPHTVFCTHLPAPANLTMYSQHFVHLLNWEAGPGSPGSVHYTVIFRSLSQNWTKLDSCAEVYSPLRCNLTEAFSDPYETYYTSVSASLGNQTSLPTDLSPFQPLRNTVPEPPMLTVSPCNGSLCVQIQAPSERLLSAYNCSKHTSNCFKYKLDITSNGELKFSKETQKLETVVLEHLVPGQRYCVNISILNRSLATRPAVCASVPTESNQVSDVVTSVALILLTLVCCLVFGLLVKSGYLFLRNRLPSVLSSLQSPFKVLLILPSRESLNAVSVEPSTQGNDEEDEEENDYKEDESVPYEGLRRQRENFKEISETGSSSITSSPEAQYRPKVNRTCGPENEIPKSSIQVPEALCSAAVLTPQCRNEDDFQWKPKGLLAINQTLSEQLRNKDLRFVGPKDVDKKGQGADVECGINVNLFSLSLGGFREDGHWDENRKMVGNLQIQKLQLSSSPQRIPDHIADLKLTYSPSSERDITDSEKKENMIVEKKTEQEEEEEEEDYSDYMKRN
ncbi:interferon alpha/beta receptor 2-like [Hoplias malabaricus]|uniref:interferon alpha/beta receptor 2-like n=1 Tax=Hoplias malabaricus TaxID=27720 RepID=UPI003461A139